VRDRFLVLWTLASGDPSQEIEEAEGKLAARLHRTFKVKISAQSPEADMARLRRIAAALGDRAALIVDVNQALCGRPRERKHQFGQVMAFPYCVPLY